MSQRLQYSIISICNQAFAESARGTSYQKLSGPLRGVEQLAEDSRKRACCSHLGNAGQERERNGEPRRDRWCRQGEQCVQRWGGLRKMTLLGKVGSESRYMTLGENF